MGASGRVSSATTFSYEAPSTVRLHSTCKHAPLHSIAPPLVARAPVRAAQQRQQQQQPPTGLTLSGVAAKQYEHLFGGSTGPHQQREIVQPTAYVSCPSDTSSEQFQRVPVINDNSVHPDTGSPAVLWSNAVNRQPSLQVVPHWQVVTCSAADLLSTAAQDAQQQGVDQLDAAAGQLTTTSSLSNRNKRPQTQQAAAVSASAQPPTLRRLISTARFKQAATASDVGKLLQGVQDLLHDLPLYQLAYAAWAAGELSYLTAPSNGWLQQLLSAAEQHFQEPNSMTDDSAMATLLQALVALDVSPDAGWLAACCASCNLNTWKSPRALSSVAACLPKLGFAPDVDWCNRYLEVTAATLSAFPAISTARMLHGVVGWQHLQQQQHQEVQQQQQLDQQQQHRNKAQSQHQLVLPEHWLLPVFQQLCAHSSQLKPPEIAMILQAMQRLQQQQQQQQDTAGALDQPGSGQLLPPPGHQPVTPLQQASQQLMNALLAAVQQQLARFKVKDMTVMLFAVSSMLQQQRRRQEPKKPVQPAVQWPWLQLVLSAVQAQMPHYDARGLATCLAAAAVLIEPHLQAQREQQSLQHTVTPAQGGQLQSGSTLAKPLQRWIHAQQQQQQTSTFSSDAALPAVTSARPACIAPEAFGTAPNSSSSISSYWQQWLMSFYLHSHQLLQAFSCEDLTVSLCALASMKQVPPVPWYEQVLSAVQQQLPVMTPGQAAGVAWALGRMSLLPSQHNPAVSLVPSSTWMTGLYPRPDDREGQQLAALTAAAAAATASCRNGVSFPICSCSGPGLVRLMWAAGVCDGDPGDAWWAAAEQHLLHLADVDTNMSDGISDSSSNHQISDGRQKSTAGSSRLQQRGFGLPVQLLPMLAQAYAASGRSVPTTLSDQLFFSPSVLQQLLTAPQAGPVAALLKGLKQCGCPVPTDWLRQLSSGLQLQLPALSPHELIQVMDGLAAVGFTPQQQQSRQLVHGQDGSLDRPSLVSVSSSSWAGTCLQAAYRHMAQLPASQLSVLVWTLVKLKMKPPVPWLEAALQRMQSGFLDAPASSLGLFITATARLGYLPSSDWLAGFMMATHRKAAAMAADPHSNKLQLVRFILMTLWAFADLRVSSISHRWLKSMLLTVHQQLPLLQPQHCVALLQVLGRLQCRPSPRFLQNVLDHTGDCSSLSAAQLVKVIFAAASLRWQPNRSWCQMFLAASAKQLASMDPQGLALVHWSLAVIKLMPTESWKDTAVAAVVSQVECMNSHDLSMIMWSWGKLMVHLTPRQEPSRVQARRQRQQWRRWLQERWHQQQQLIGQQGPQHQGWQRQWVQQQWQDWMQVQQQESGESLPPSSAERRLLQRRKGVADELLTAALALQGTYSQSSLVFLLVGAARLQLRPSQQWLQSMVLQGSSESLSVLNGVQLQQMVWALAKLGFRAPARWLESVSVLLEVAWQDNNFTRHSAAAALLRLQQVAAWQEQHVEQEVASLQGLEGSAAVLGG